MNKPTPVAWLILVGLSSHLALSAAAPASFRLENGSVALVLDSKTAGLISIENKLAGETYMLDDPGFRLEAGIGTTPGGLGMLTPASANLVNAACDGSEARYTYSSGPLTLTVTWRLDPGDDFATKRARIEFAGTGTYNVSRFEMFDWGFKAKPTRSIPYYGFLRASVLRGINDGDPVPPSDTSTAFFHRWRDGGIFSALSCDFVLMQQDDQAGRSRSIYWPGFILAAGQPFESEQGIVGVYRRKGPFHAPTKRAAQLPSFHVPNIDIRLDRGEIDAMSAAVRKFIKPGLYFTLVNGWGVGLPRMIESQADADTFMHGIDTLAKIPEIEGLHFVHSWCGLTREFHEQGLAMKLTPNPFARQVFEHAREKGMKLSMFIGASNNYPLQGVEGPLLRASQELLSVDARGVRREKNIAFSRQYTDFIYQTVCGLREQYPQIGGLTYDFLSLQPDYDTTHGYLPGRASLYPQYAMLRDTNRRLRARFPDLMLRGQIGWMWFGPWLAEGMSMCHNAGDHLCDNHRNFLDFHMDYQFANNIRLSNWFTNNCKMHPRDKMNSNSIHNGSNFRAWDYGAWQYAILSQIATSQVFGMLHDLPDEQKGEIFPKRDGEFFQKWIEWHKAHAEYYRRENDLFGEPRLDGVDGYAYGNGRDSIVFLCNPTWQTQRVAVPVNGEIHLPGGAGAWTIKELYPEERYHLGLNDGGYAFGSTFVIDVPPQTVMVFEVRPDQPGQPLLLGVEGSVQAAPGGFAVSGVAGPPGTERLVAVRAPRGGGERVTFNGQPVPVQRQGNLLLGRIKFGGQPVQPEITDWRAVREGERLKLTARFTPPASAREALAGQHLPESSAYAGAQWLESAAWLDWGRCIIHIPAVPTGFDADHLTGATLQRLVKSFPARATLNGRSIAVHSNIMGEPGKRSRWSGYFIDASQAVEYGRANELTLDLPAVSEDQFHGLYLPNLERQKTSALEPLAAPASLRVIPAPEAADAFIPRPVVTKSGERYTVYLRMNVTATANSTFNAGEITAEGGAITDRVVLGADPRWRPSADSTRPGEMLLGRRAKTISMVVEGGPATRLRLGTGPDAGDVAFGSLLEEWERRNDPYDPTLGAVEWTARKATVAVELTAPWSDKQRVE